jgi:hypothetical protein
VSARDAQPRASWKKPRPAMPMVDEITNTLPHPAASVTIVAAHSGQP